MEILNADDDNLCVSNLIKITDYSKRGLYNKRKETNISLANQPGSSKEGTTVDGLPSQKTWTEGSAPQGNSELQQNARGEENQLYDDRSSMSSSPSEEEGRGPDAAPSG